MRLIKKVENGKDTDRGELSTSFLRFVRHTPRQKYIMRFKVQIIVLLSLLLCYCEKDANICYTWKSNDQIEMTFYEEEIVKLNILNHKLFLRYSREKRDIRLYSINYSDTLFFLYDIRDDSLLLKKGNSTSVLYKNSLKKPSLITDEYGLAIYLKNIIHKINLDLIGIWKPINGGYPISIDKNGNELNYNTIDDNKIDKIRVSSSMKFVNDSSFVLYNNFSYGDSISIIDEDNFNNFFINLVTNDYDYYYFQYELKGKNKLRLRYFRNEGKYYDIEYVKFNVLSEATF